MTQIYFLYCMVQIAYCINMMMAVLKRSKWPEDPQVHFLNDGFYLFFWWGNNFICSFKSLNDIQIQFIRCLCTYKYNSQLFFFFASPVLFLLMWVECLKFSLQIKKLYVCALQVAENGGFVLMKRDDGSVILKNPATVHVSRMLENLLLFMKYVSLFHVT